MKFGRAPATRSTVMIGRGLPGTVAGGSPAGILSQTVQAPAATLDVQRIILRFVGAAGAVVTLVPNSNAPRSHALPTGRAPPLASLLIVTPYLVKNVL